MIQKFKEEKVTLQDTKSIRTMTDFHKAVKQIAESLPKPEYYFPCNVKCNSEGQMEYEIYLSQFSRHFSSSTPEGAIYELQHFVDKNSGDIVIVETLDDLSDTYSAEKLIMSEVKSDGLERTGLFVDESNTFTAEEVSDSAIWPQVDTDESQEDTEDDLPW